MPGKITTVIEKRYGEYKNTKDSDQDDMPRTQTSSRPIIPDVHLSDYLEILSRRKWVAILFFVLIVGSVASYSVMTTPQYEASSKVLLRGRPTPMNPLGETANRLPERNRSFKTQVNLLGSRALAHKVIDKLSLEDVLSTPSKPNPILAFAKRLIPSDDNKSKSPPVSNKNSKAAKRLRVLNWYQKHLSIEPVPESSLVQVRFTGPDKDLITQIVNTHTKTAIENTIQQNQGQAKDAFDWLKTQIAEQKKEVELSQRAIYDFKKENNVLSLEESQIIFSQEFQELNSALTKAKSVRISKQATYLQLQEILKKKQDVMLLPEISNYSVMQNLRNKLIDLKSDQIEMGTKYGPKHPKMVELENGIGQIQVEIAKETQRLKDSIKAELNRAKAIERSIIQSLNEQKQVAMKLGERAIEYDVLKQQAESTQDIYDFLLKQSEDLRLSSAISSSNMRIVDKAEVPINPVRPKIVLNILLAVFAALFVGTGCAFFVDYLDNTVKTPMDVAVRLGLPVLGMIPLHKSLQGKNPNIKLLEDINNPERNDDALPIYHISNRLPDELRSPAYGLFGRVLIVESVTKNEGKTTVIARIASNLTEAGLRVLLVDCDFQRPSLGKLFAVSNNGGLGKSIDRIMTHHLTSGTLSNYSMDDLFFLTELRKLSGHLMVRNDEQTFIAHFLNGVLIHIEDQNIPENNRIGNMLLKGGFITKVQLQDALQRHQRTGQPLGYILVNAGYIGREKLRGPLRLQIEEYLQKLFSWKKGHFGFKPGIINIYENEKIFFEEDYAPMINNLGRVENSKFIEKELFSHIVDLKKNGLFLLPAGTSHKLIGALNQILMKKIFEKLRQRFDVVLLDTPPLDAASGIESILQLADGIVLVIKAGNVSIKNLNGAIDHLPKDKIIGTILNQAQVKPQNYYY